jgi:hypothetical protein
MTGTIPMDGLLTLLNGMDLEDRRWLTENLTKQIELEEKEARRKAFLSAPAYDWEKENQELYDEVFASFSADWGGDGTAEEIAEDLRRGRVNSRTVDVW